MSGLPQVADTRLPLAHLDFNLEKNSSLIHERYHMTSEPREPIESLSERSRKWSWCTLIIFDLCVCGISFFKHDHKKRLKFNGVRIIFWFVSTRSEVSYVIKFFSFCSHLRFQICLDISFLIWSPICLKIWDLLKSLRRGSRILLVSSYGAEITLTIISALSSFLCCNHAAFYLLPFSWFLIISIKPS